MQTSNSNLTFGRKHKHCGKRIGIAFSNFIRYHTVLMLFLDSFRLTISILHECWCIWVAIERKTTTKCYYNKTKIETQCNFTNYSTHSSHSVTFNWKIVTVFRFVGSFSSWKIQQLSQQHDFVLCSLAVD